MQETTLSRLLESRREADSAALASVMTDAVAAARSAWPTINVAEARFAAYLADRLPNGIDLRTALRGMRVSDLYLACACAHGDPNALAALELHYLTAIDRALRRLGMDTDAVNEVKQRLRRVLLAPDTGQPRITAFAGRGDLRRWIRVLAVRDALAMAQQARRHVAADEDRLVDLVAAGATPEIEYLKRLYRREFEIAFREAIQTLSDRERILVGQHFLDGLSVHQLAGLYRVHRATAGRWLERARGALLAATRKHMMDRLDVPPAEIESILRLVLSRLEISLRPLFRRRRS